MDSAHRQTDRILNQLERKVKKTYSESAREMSKTIAEYYKQFEKKDELMAECVNIAKTLSKEEYAVWKAERMAKNQPYVSISKTEYQQWRMNQLGRGERYEKIRADLAKRASEANETAIAYINDTTPSVYSLNRNYASKQIEKEVKGVSFDTYDESTVRRLIKDNPKIMPHYPPERALDRGIDLAFGQKQIDKAVTSGILQGKSIGKIADDIGNRVNTMNRAQALRSARTAMTSAQNGGRQDSYEDAEAMGIEMVKVWVATLDERTREWHADADGQEVPIDEPFDVDGEELMYPADPSGSPANTYNCRCTMIAQVKGVDFSKGTRR